MGTKLQNAYNRFGLFKALPIIVSIVRTFLGVFFYFIFFNCFGPSFKQMEVKLISKLKNSTF